MMLHDGLSERLPPGFWSVATAADRWPGIRGRLLKIRSAVDENAANTLEALCFVIDEVLTDAGRTGSLTEYGRALDEVCNVLVASAADATLQTLIVSEVQKLALPT